MVHRNFLNFDINLCQFEIFIYLNLQGPSNMPNASHILWFNRDSITPAIPWTIDLRINHLVRMQNCTFVLSEWPLSGSNGAFFQIKRFYLLHQQKQFSSLYSNLLDLEWGGGEVQWLIVAIYHRIIKYFK